MAAGRRAVGSPQKASVPAPPRYPCRPMRPSVVLLLPKKSYRADDFFRAAQRLDVEVVVASDRCHQLAELWPSAGQAGDTLVLTQTLPLPFREPAAAADELARQVSDARPRAVVGVDDETAVIAALTSERLGLPHNPIEAVAAARNKARSRTLLRDAGVPVPWFEVFPSSTRGEALRSVAAR